MNKIVCFRYPLHIQKFLESEFYQEGIMPTYNHLHGASEVHWQPLSSTTLSHDVSFSYYLLSPLALHWPPCYTTIKRYPHMDAIIVQSLQHIWCYVIFRNCPECFFIIDASMTKTLSSQVCQ
jgi:hypothetical protein